MSVNLNNYQQFKEILKNYRISDRAEEALEDLRLVLLLAPTSTGRNTVIRHLLTTGKYHYVVSDTTRPPRINDGILEQNGKEYWFRSEEDVLADLKAGEFLEAELIHEQQVSGISIRELARARREQKIAITDIDLKGVHNVVSVKPDVVVILLVPPSFDEWQRRIARRGKMSSQEFLRRLKTAERIFQDGSAQSYYRYVIAEDVKQSAQIIDSIANGGRNPHQDRGRELTAQLQATLKDFIENQKAWHS